MTVYKINALTVPAESGDELANRFAARAGAVDGAPGFEGFDLLKPTDGRTTWLVVTKWADDASFEAWSSSRANMEAHGHGGGGHGHGASGDEHAGHAGHEHGEGHAHGEGRPAPVATSAELWSFERAGGSASSGA